MQMTPLAFIYGVILNFGCRSHFLGELEGITADKYQDCPKANQNDGPAERIGKICIGEGCQKAQERTNRDE